MFATEAETRTEEAGSAHSSPGSGDVILSSSGQIPGFRLGNVLGRGAVGVVYRAEQELPRREVALKMLDPSWVHSPTARHRFRREVDLCASLNHPGIAQVYGGGMVEAEGLFYYAMELIEGCTLSEYVDREKLALRVRLELFQSVCDAVDYAHRHGVMHRDLKPSNILVNQDGKTKTVDFGLAKALEREGDDLAGSISEKENAPAFRSMEGSIVGTPAFMSPEQASGSLDIDNRTDIYSLGVILFFLTTGDYPYSLEGGPLEILQRVSQADPKRPSSIRDEVSPELESIILKAMERSPEDRYRSAGELSEDIVNYLTGRPVRARPLTAAYFLSKAVRRHRAAIVTAASLVLAGILATVVYIRSIQRYSEETEKAREAAERRQGRAEDLLNFLVLDITQSLQTAGQHDLAAKSVAKIEGVFAEYPESDVTPGVLRTRAVAQGVRGRSFLNERRFQEALDAFQSALRYMEGLPRGTVPDNIFLYDLGSTYNKAAAALLNQGTYEEASEYYREASEIWRSILEPEVAKPTKYWVLSKLASVTTLRGLGAVAEKQKLYETAHQHYLEAAAVLDSLEDIVPLKDNRVAWCLTREALASSFSRLEKHGDALDAQREALKVWKELFEEEPENASHCYSLLWSHAKLAGICRRAGRPEEAWRVALEGSQLLMGSLTPLRPSSMDRGPDLMLSDEFFELGHLLDDRGLSIEAKERYEQSVLVYESVVNPRDEQMPVRLSLELCRRRLMLAIVSRQAGDDALRMRHARLANEDLKTLKERFPGNQDVLKYLRLSEKELVP